MAELLALDCTLVFRPGCPQANESVLPERHRVIILGLPVDRHTICLLGARTVAALHTRRDAYRKRMPIGCKLQLVLVAR